MTTPMRHKRSSNYKIDPRYVGTPIEKGIRMAVNDWGGIRDVQRVLIDMNPAPGMHYEDFLDSVFGCVELFGGSVAEAHEACDYIMYGDFPYSTGNHY